MAYFIQDLVIVFLKMDSDLGRRKRAWANASLVFLIRSDRPEVIDGAKLAEAMENEAKAADKATEKVAQSFSRCLCSLDLCRLPRSRWKSVKNWMWHVAHYITEVKRRSWTGEEGSGVDSHQVLSLPWWYPLVIPTCRREGILQLKEAEIKLRAGVFDEVFRANPLDLQMWLLYKAESIVSTAIARFQVQLSAGTVAAGEAMGSRGYAIPQVFGHVQRISLSKGSLFN